MFRSMNGKAFMNLCHGYYHYYFKSHIFHVQVLSPKKIIDAQMYSFKMQCNKVFLKGSILQRCKSL